MPDNKQNLNNQVLPEMTVFRSICILLIIVSHIPLREGFSGPFGLFPVYSFQVAAFVFSAGYLYKDSNDERPLSYVVRKTRSLLIPTLLINAMYGVLNTVLRHRLGFTWGSDISLYTVLIAPFVDGHQFNLDYALWFVPPLYLAEITNVFLRHLLYGASRLSKILKELVVFACYLALGVIAIQASGASGLDVGLALLFNRTCFFLSFLGIGRAWRLFIDDRLISNNLIALVVLCHVKLAIDFATEGSYVYYPSWAIFPRGAIVTYSVSLVGIAFYLRLSKALAPLIGARKWITILADDSFSIMAHHRLGFFLVTCCMAAVALLTPLNRSFDFALFHSMPFTPHEPDYWFLPRNIAQFYLVYFSAGIAVPVAIHTVWLKIKSFSSFSYRLFKKRAFDTNHESNP